MPDLPADEVPPAPSQKASLSLEEVSAFLVKDEEVSDPIGSLFINARLFHIGVLTRQYTRV